MQILQTGYNVQFTAYKLIHGSFTYSIQVPLVTSYCQLSVTTSYEIKPAAYKY